MTSSQGTVALNSTAGVLSAVTDNHDGSYTATLTSASSIGSATISGTIGGSAIGHNATVLFKNSTATTVTLESGQNPSVVGNLLTFQAEVVPHPGTMSRSSSRTGRRLAPMP